MSVIEDVVSDPKRLAKWMRIATWLSIFMLALGYALIMAHWAGWF
ncbi:MAG TPA: hypothetical protein VMB46_05720 [Methanomassiliicoccales archaeon]|nr:hypothetical protein [Methanomassiliicoccales archaeon]